MFLGQSILLTPLFDLAASLRGQKPQELTRVNATEPDSLTNRIQKLKNYLVTAGENSTSSKNAMDVSDLDGHQRKRQRKDGPMAGFDLSGLGHDSESPALPPLDLLNKLVELYFSNVHPWVPILHVKEFRERMQTDKGRAESTNILHAIVAMCIRFSQDPGFGDFGDRKRLARESREIVILRCIETSSLENLQALCILMFERIGSGSGPSSWSMLGTLTQSLDTLQLDGEEDEQKRHRWQDTEILTNQMASLRPSTTWTEVEERRRIFWTVFLMDRFCSVAAGSSTSLTGADIRRRPPCEGRLWEAGQAVKTPYFMLADNGHNASASSTRKCTSHEEIEAIGGFALCVESTVSLSLAKGLLLQRPENVSDVEKVSIWLMRFKELDLRLDQ